MEEQSGVDDEEGEAPPGELLGSESLEAELSNELAVLHRVFRHDFRNSLNVVLSRAELAKDASDDDVLDDYLEGIIREATELVETVDQVSLVQRLASSDFAPDVVNIVPTLQRLLAAFDDRTAATINARLPESAWVWLNPSYEEAFHELIENAIVHNDSPEPCVTVQVVQSEHTEVIIADNGPGMPPEIKPSLEATEVDPIHHLTSLGLWTAYWILTRSGGTLTIENTEPRGCRVTISLRPASPPDV